MRRAIEKVGVTAMLAGCLVGAGDASAKPESTTPGKGRVLGAGYPAASLAELTSDDPAVVRAGLDDARLAGPKAASAGPAIVALLRAGLPYPLAEAALDTLSDLELPEVQAFVPYTKHRDPKVRRAAVRALGKVPARSAPLAVDVVRASLSDPDALVRATAAIGLGSLKAHAALPDLFLALDHHVYEAAVSLGQLCTGQECDALVGRLGKLPFDVLTSGIESLLLRPGAEVPDEAKIVVIEKVRDVGTADANKFLRGIQTRWPRGGSEKVRRAVDAAVLATVASPGAGS